MRIGIFGVGGVGGYFGGRLAQAGHEVTFIARGRHLEAMQRQGLRVRSVKGDFWLPSVSATDNPAQVGPVEAVIVAVKAWQVAEAAQAMRPLFGPETMVVPLQNGVEAPERLAAALGAERVLGGFCRIVSYISEPGQINNAGGDPYLAFGERDNQRSERVERLLAAFGPTIGVTAENPPDIQAAMWGKFLQISGWSGLGAITRVPVGQWRDLPGTRRMWQAAMAETLAVARAHAIALGEGAIERATAYVDKLQPEATASMQRDILAGRPSELDTLSGGVVRLGQEVGVPTPTHTFIYHTLLPQERQARGEG